MGVPVRAGVRGGAPAWCRFRPPEPALRRASLRYAALNRRDPLLSQPVKGEESLDLQSPLTTSPNLDNCISTPLSDGDQPRGFLG